ncbi:hypothetical protein LDV99_001758 [Vibrio parahaemolyticus]|uniref:ribbon-helix-helix domain-containing protein n=1 Tax=Vibrio parahaemolyticus TaxID=670 RepID=UPI000B33DD24|nr:hypothetical protein [Vibrio parahaemolyticus]EIE5874930.1 hypothetical protein [Vibrio parahaemolyticus]
MSKTTMRSYRLPTELLEEIEVMAKDEDRNVTNMVTVLLKEAVKARKEQNQ